MTDSDREKRIEIVLYHIMQRDRTPARDRLTPRMEARRLLDALGRAEVFGGPVVPLERAQELERERDEAIAAAREMAKVIVGQARVMEQEFGMVQAPAAMRSFLSRWPSFLPPDREE